MEGSCIDLLALFCVGYVLGHGINLLVPRFLVDPPSGGKKLLRTHLIRVVFGLIAAGLYWWEVKHQGFSSLPHQSIEIDVARFLYHLFLLVLLSLIAIVDYDEQLIPDTLQIVATFTTYLLAATLPEIMLPTPDGVVMNWNWPLPWSYTGRSVVELIIAWLCFEHWVFTLATYTVGGWSSRHLVRIKIWWMRSSHEFLHSTPLRLFHLVGAVFIGLVWIKGDSGWNQMLSALIGSSIGILAMRGFRILVSETVGREALGFGDVILAGTIGSFVGWQGLISVVVFSVLSVVFSLPILIIPSSLNKRITVPFGPYMVIGAVISLWVWPIFVQDLELLLVSYLSWNLVPWIAGIAVLFILTTKTVFYISYKYIRRL